MKKIILSGLLAGLVMLIIGFSFSGLLSYIIPSLGAEYANANIFRPWNDPLMSIYFLYPFVLGIILAWAWNGTKSLFKGSLWKRASYFGLSIWFVSSIPGMIITYSSFQVSLLMILSWLLCGLINGILAGLVFARMNK